MYTSYKKNIHKLLVVLCSIIFLSTCARVNEQELVASEPLFSLLPAKETGIAFKNQLAFNKDFNIYTYRNFYNGGGVGLGDINNDGLIDIYFTANMQSNKLYLNKGDFKFEDITKAAGVAGTKAWSTGVSIADVNGDGLLDIYVCNSGDIEGDNKQNELFINNGNLTFSESAETYGLADKGFSTHGAFFDYDKDGDLDLYLLNNSYQAIGSFNLQKNERPKRDPVGGDKLFRNEGDTFIDVSEEAGIYGSIIGFGLGVTVGDIDKDGWQDIYVSNDFFERDYIYMNNKDGTFNEVLEEKMRSISATSMGADMADFNNDAHADIFVTEMLPDTHERLKTVTTFESWDRYQLNIKNDYYHQFTRNTFHLNNTDGTYSEIGRLAGVEATDWSWGALIVDLDNDGWKDLFVANGILGDLTNQDYIQFFSDENIVKEIITGDKVDYQKLIDAIPSNKLPNYAFRNNRDYTFTDKAAEWGLATPSFSNGSAYGDLDNDGDPDLVVNNVNMEAFIYRNETDKVHPENHYLKLELVGEGKNPFALGTKITVKYANEIVYLEQMPVRGFESTIDHRPHIGVGTAEKIDSLLVTWPDGKLTVMTDVAINQSLKLKQSDALKTEQKPTLPAKSLFTNVGADYGIDFIHQENAFVDFDRDRLIFHMLSTEGPKMAKADVNADGLQDFYIGGAKGFSGALYIQTSGGQFKKSSTTVFENDKGAEDVDVLFFDADNDGDADLYVASGGNEFSSVSSFLLDRLYLNDGQGNFIKNKEALPFTKYESTGCVAASDYEGDGDLDLFVGNRLIPFLYGKSGNGYLLQNDGQGHFEDISQETAPAFKELGMITDAIWEDIDNDSDDDLIVVGDWMPVKVFMNEQGVLKEVEALEKSHGWWNTIEQGDFNNDGLIDFVVGNHGLNSRFEASKEKPMSLYVNDFDKNGSVEQVINMHFGDTAYPMVLRHDLVMQLPHLKKKYLKYENYKTQTITDIFTAEELQKAIVKEAYMRESALLLNKGDGNFEVKALPTEAQFSPTYAFLTGDFNGDGLLDIISGGNLFNVKPEVGRYDASYGLFLAGNGDGTFQTINTSQSGISFSGEVRDIEVLNINGEEIITIVKNNAPIQFLKLEKSMVQIPTQ
ncbi:MAG: VCBS repeat-containing protein [Bacteroidota bacterium]